MGSSRWGFDSYSHVLDPAHAYAQGWRVSSRYISGVVNKDTTASEQAAIHAAGLDSLINYELATDDALQGFGAGQTVGRHANAMTLALGAPTHNPDGTRVAIFFSCDMAATANQVRSYYQGLRTTTDYAIGAYGGIEMLTLLREGVIDYWWQANAGSWSGHNSSNFPTDPAACIRQYVGSPFGSPPNPGFGIDTNEFLGADCGLWKSPRNLTPAPAPKPTPTPLEEDVKTFTQFMAAVKNVPANRIDITVGMGAICISDGTWFRWVQTPGELLDAEGTVMAERGDRLIQHQPGPVADLYAFGRPQDKATADLLGLAFP